MNNNVCLYAIANHVFRSSYFCSPTVCNIYIAQSPLHIAYIGFCYDIEPTYVG